MDARCETSFLLADGRVLIIKSSDPFPMIEGRIIDAAIVTQNEHASMLEARVNKR